MTASVRHRFRTTCSLISSRTRERRINSSRSSVARSSLNHTRHGRATVGRTRLIKLWPRLNVTDQTREHGLIRMVLIHGLLSGARDIIPTPSFPGLLQRPLCLASPNEAEEISNRPKIRCFSFSCIVCIYSAVFRSLLERQQTIAASSVLISPFKLSTRSRLRKIDSRCFVRPTKKKRKK